MTEPAWDRPTPGGGTPRLPLDLAVECYAGHRGEETPRRFRLAGVAIDISAVVDRWLSPDHRYFRVQDGQGDLYILRNEVGSGRWELTVFRRGAMRPGDPARPEE